ncbi:MAG: hypothetical protein U9Q72_00895 [Patescibacteria group bacterium]|nr:hypothetical protein [Patescibacteria group bacterium]
MESKKELKQIIESSSLEKTDKQMWALFAEAVGEKEIKLVLDLVKESPEMLNFATKNLKNKFQAMQAKDKKAMDTVVKEEKKQAENIS